jgi:Na+/H+ antiporter NhaA
MVSFRGGLAFEESGLLDRAKLGMLQASELAAVLGASALQAGCLLKPICWLHQKMVQNPIL